MDKASSRIAGKFLDDLLSFLRKCLFNILSTGPIPNHIAFIMDGNRRFAKKRNLVQGVGHTIGFMALLSMLKYCHEMGVKHVTIYAFSIDNFKRRPEEVMSLMDLMQEKIEGLLGEESIVNRYGIRVYFSGNLKLLSDPVRLAAERVMLATAKNSKAVLSICVAYSSTNEIVHAVRESCEEKLDEISVLDESGAGYGLVKVGGNIEDDKERLIKLTDIDKHMYMAVTPDPDIIVAVVVWISIYIIQRVLRWRRLVIVQLAGSVMTRDYGNRAKHGLDSSLLLLYSRECTFQLIALRNFPLCRRM